MSSGEGRYASATAGGGAVQRPGFSTGGVDVSLSGIVGLKDLVLNFFVRWWVGALIGWLIGSIGGIVIIWATKDEFTDDYGFTTATSGNTGLAALVAFGLPLVIGLAVLFIPIRIGHGEYGQLVDSFAGASEGAYANIFRGIVERDIPLSAVTPRRFSPGPMEPVQNYLLVRRDKLEIWVIVAPSGNDLWISWTSWIRLLPIMMPLYYVRNFAERLLIKGSDFHQALRVSKLKAVEAAVHSAVIDGMDRAMLGDVTEISVAFGHDLEVEGSRSSEGGAAYPATPTVPVPTTGVPSFGPAEAVPSFGPAEAVPSFGPAEAVPPAFPHDSGPPSPPPMPW